FRQCIVFSFLSIHYVFLSIAFIVPDIPIDTFSIRNFTLTKSIFLMLLFAILMIITSYSMIKKEKDVTDEPPQKHQFNYLLILIEGTLVGILTGLVGAGGGFLII